MERYHNVPPGTVCTVSFLAVVALHRVTITALRVHLIVQLHQHVLALPSALNRRYKDAVGAVGYPWLHRPADDLGHKHAAMQLAAEVNGNPVLPLCVLGYPLRVAESSGCRL